MVIDLLLVSHTYGTHINSLSGKYNRTETSRQDLILNFVLHDTQLTPFICCRFEYSWSFNAASWDRLRRRNGSLELTRQSVS